ncbi:hypothetical protein BD408DRAFT_436012 [Parasitella parasitica]|nr:hypothetical protein BD408DRAFT_436012 [Parasitella parasitica]
MSIWQALTSFCSQDLSMLDEEVLVALGTAYSTLWKYHWRCVIDTEPWIASAYRVKGSAWTPVGDKREEMKEL